MRAAFDRLGVDLGELSLWRNKGTYADDIDGLRARSGSPPLRSTRPWHQRSPAWVVSHLRRSLGADVAEASAERDSLAAVIAGQDVRLGIPAPGGVDI